MFQSEEHNKKDDADDEQSYDNHNRNQERCKKHRDETIKEDNHCKEHAYNDYTRLVTVPNLQADDGVYNHVNDSEDDACYCNHCQHIVLILLAISF